MRRHMQTALLLGRLFMMRTKPSWRCGHWTSGPGQSVDGRSQVAHDWMVVRVSVVVVLEESVSVSFV